MKKIVLVFPNASSMVDFLLIYRVNDVEANSMDLTISGHMSKKLIVTAISEYGAEMAMQLSVEFR